MVNEELVHRKYPATGQIADAKFRSFEELNIGVTSIAEIAL